MPFVVTLADLTPADQLVPGQQATTSTFVDDWLWNTANPPPINGQVNTDSRNWAGATHLVVSNHTSAGDDASATLLQVMVGSSLSMQHATDATRTVTYTVASAPVASANNSVDIAVSYVSSSGGIPNSNTRCTLTMVVPTAADVPHLITGRHLPLAAFHEHHAAFDPTYVAQELDESPSGTIYLDYSTLGDDDRQSLLATGVNSVYDQVRQSWAFWRVLP